MIRTETHSCGSYMERMGDGNRLHNIGVALRTRIYHLPTKEQQIVLEKLRNGKCCLPKKVWGDIIEMTEYNMYNRLTDRVEQCLLSNVIRGMVEEIIDEETNSQNQP